MAATTTRQMVTRYCQQKRAAGHSMATIKGNRNILLAFAEIASTDPGRLRRSDVDRWLRTQTHVAAGTRCTRWATVRCFLDWLVDAGKLKANPMHGMPAPKVPRRVHRALDDDQARALAAEPTTLRDLLVVTLGLQLGLRTGEMVRLEVGDVSLMAGTVHVHGKGGHERVVPLTVEAREVLVRYLSAEGITAGPLLRSQTHPQRGISAQHLSRLVAELARHAGVKVRPRDGVSAHALRHTCATGIYLASRDVLAVRDVLGHASLATTEGYVRGLDIEALRPAVEGRSYLPLRPAS